MGGLLSNVDCNATLLGLRMMMWGNSIVASPFSGINLSIQGRFGPSAFALMRWNASYALAMSLACVLVLHAYAASFLVPAWSLLAPAVAGLAWSPKLRSALACRAESA